MKADTTGLDGQTGWFWYNIEDIIRCQQFEEFAREIRGGKTRVAKRLLNDNNIREIETVIRNTKKQCEIGAQFRCSICLADTTNANTAIYFLVHGNIRGT